MVTTKDFNDMATSELYELNRLLVLEIRARSKEEARSKSSRFKHGQQVKFVDRSGVVHIGTIIKFNTKTISIKVGSVLWRVSPSVLMEVEPSGHDVIETLDAKEVQEFEERHEDPPSKTDKPKTQSDSAW